MLERAKGNVGSGLLDPCNHARMDLEPLPHVALTPPMGEAKSPQVTRNGIKHCPAGFVARHRVPIRCYHSLNPRAYTIPQVGTRLPYHPSRRWRALHASRSPALLNLRPTVKVSLQTQSRSLSLDSSTKET